MDVRCSPATAWCWRTPRTPRAPWRRPEPWRGGAAAEAGADAAAGGAARLLGDFVALALPSTARAASAIPPRFGAFGRSFGDAGPPGKGGNVPRSLRPGEGATLGARSVAGGNGSSSAAGISATTPGSASAEGGDAASLAARGGDAGGVGATGLAATGLVAAGPDGPRGDGGGSVPPASMRSICSIRWTSAAGAVSRSGRTKRTRDVSRMIRGSRASRISTSASPSNSSERVAVAGPIAATICGSTPGRGIPMCTRNTSRSDSIRSRVNWRMSRPRSMARLTPVRTPRVSFVPRALVSSLTSKPSSTPPAAATWSSADSASRAEPLPLRVTASRVASSSPSPASVATPRTSSSSVSNGNRRNSKCWVRLRMVGSTFCGSVVASTNTTWSGGSSSVFNKALDAAVESM